MKNINHSITHSGLSSFPKLLRNTSLGSLMLMQILIACNSTKKEEVIAITPTEPKIELPQQPVYTYKPFMYNGVEIGKMKFSNDYFMGVDGAKEVGSQTIKDSLGSNVVTVSYLLKDNTIYCFTNKLTDIVAIPGNSLQGLSNTALLVTNNNIASLYKFPITNNGNKVTPVNMGTIKSFVLLEDSTLSDVMDISDFTTKIWGQGIILITESGKKYLVTMNSIPLEISDVKSETITDLGNVKKKFHAISSTGQKYVLGSYPDLIPYSQITHTTDGAVAYMQDGNLMAFEDALLGGDVPTALKAISSGKIVEYTYPRHEENNENNTSLSDVIHKKAIVQPTEICKNISSKFTGFKIKYIGISYAGESEDYSYSSNGKDFYIFNGPDEKGNYTTSIDIPDRIISTIPLSDYVLKSKLFTDSYVYGPWNHFRYIGNKDGNEVVEYTVQGAPGNTIQTGEEVTNVLMSDVLKNPAGYSTPEFFYKEGTQVKKLESNTQCPKGTTIVIRYKKNK